MADALSELYQDFLLASYDCVDRIVLNGYFRQGHSGGGFRVWWQQLYGSDESLDNTHLMRLAGRFSRRVYGYAQAHQIPLIRVPVGERKHELAEEYLAKTKVTQGLFLVLVGRAQAPVWDVSRKHHLERKTPMPYVNHDSFHILDSEWGHITLKISGHPGLHCIAIGRAGSVSWSSHRCRLQSSASGLRSEKTSREAIHPAHPPEPTLRIGSLGVESAGCTVPLREKIIKPLLAAAQGGRKTRGPKNPPALDLHYQCVRLGMQGVFQELGLAA